MHPRCTPAKIWALMIVVTAVPVLNLLIFLIYACQSVHTSKSPDLVVYSRANLLLFAFGVVIYLLLNRY